MKKIFLLCLLSMPAWLGGCIEDKGNYDYSVAERPVVVLANRYMAPMVDDGNGGEKRGNIVIDPEVTYSDMSRLSFLYTFPNPDDADAPFTYEGAADGSLDDPMEELVANGSYTGQLIVTVADNSAINPEDPGMKYFYDVAITLGSTPFTVGSLLLADVGGNTQIHFITPEGELFEDVYPIANEGETLAGKPLKVIYSVTFMGGFNYGYVVLTDNGGRADGAVLNVTSLAKLRSMEDNFLTAPRSLAGPMTLGASINGYMNVGVAAGFATTGPVVLLMDGKIYGHRMNAGNPTDPQNNMFEGNALEGDYYITAFDNDLAGTDMGYSQNNFWGWDDKAKRLVHFQMGGMAPIGFNAPNVIDQSHSVWNPDNVGELDLITLQVHRLGGWMVMSDAGKTYILGWMQPANTNTGESQEGRMDGLRKFEFPFANLITPQTLWTIDHDRGVLYFSSGDKIYRYDPNTPTTEPEALAAELDGDVSMLEFRSIETQVMPGMRVFNFGLLEVGTEGHLYTLDMEGPKGGRGTIVGTPYTFTGKPVDVYNHVTQ